MYELKNPVGAISTVPTPMTASAPLAVRSQGIVWAHTDRHEVVLLDIYGKARTIFRVDEPLESITSAVRDTYLEYWAAEYQPPPEPVPFPSAIPAFDRVFFSADGQIWARRYKWGAIPEEWVRLEQEGASGRFRFPAGVQILAATASEAYGVFRDELDVEHLVRFHLN
jgi:hypothetical protein